MPTYDETFAVLISSGEVVATLVVDPAAEDYQDYIDAVSAQHEADTVRIVGENERPSPGWLVEADGTWHAPPRPRLEFDPVERSAVNVPVSLTVRFVDGELDATTVEVTVTHGEKEVARGRQQIGASFDFVSEIAGNFTITAERSGHTAQTGVTVG